jgi:N-acetylneuraminic acid mutarotase
MKKQNKEWTKAHLLRGGFYLLLALTGTLVSLFRLEARVNVSYRTLTFAERVAYQRTIEDVYWRHRIWPKDRSDPKPSLDAVISQAQLEKKVKDYLRNSRALEDYWQRPVSAEQLQAEMDRMAQNTRQPEVLQQLFEALGNDPFVIAECLARPALAERLVANWYAYDHRIHGDLEQRDGTELQAKPVLAAPQGSYRLPKISGGSCVEDNWTATAVAPDGRAAHTAVWTGSEMIVWGGFETSFYLHTGGRYSPSTDSWVATTTANVPTARGFHTAVWTGNEMIVWGGLSDNNLLNSGGRYNPTTDSWIPTTTTNAPGARDFHTAVWTGSQMIVWGGSDGDYLNTGGRYDPNTDSWSATSTTTVPAARNLHTTVWTGSEMIVWGGYGNALFNTGGRYNPVTNSWTATSTTNAPDFRYYHTAVWTGSEMIVWGGANSLALNTGGKYNPSTNSWTATSTANAPDSRQSHTAVWTGNQMIVWGGTTGDFFGLNTGGKYSPTSDSWAATSITNAPDARRSHTAIWTGSEMIVWGGSDRPFGSGLASGGRYCAQGGPTPTPTATPSATPTATPGPIQLRGQKRKVNGMNTVRLNWKGATSTNVDVYRDDVLIATTPNAPPRLYTDFTGDTGRAEYTYRVCEAATSTCSNDLVVRFPE